VDNMGECRRNWTRYACGVNRAMPQEDGGVALAGGQGTNRVAARRHKFQRGLLRIWNFQLKAWLKLAEDCQFERGFS
jgi:hypothetical protein